MLGMFLILVLIGLIIVFLPVWEYSKDWGFMPSGGLGLIFITIMTLAMFDYLPLFHEQSNTSYRVVEKPKCQCDCCK